MLGIMEKNCWVKKRTKVCGNFHSVQNNMQQTFSGVRGTYRKTIIFDSGSPLMRVTGAIHK
jgi:hypothetical protein